MDERDEAREYEYLLVLDFEATCGEKTDPGFDLELQEIIELPVGLISLRERRVVGSFGTLVRPVRQPTLTAFCQALTSIRQDELAGQPTLDVALEQLLGWLSERGVTAQNALLVTCGDWDLKTMWPRQVSLRPELSTPELFWQWCNLKVIYAEHTGQSATGMMGMLRQLGIPHEGHHHRGADDVRNLGRVVVRLLEEGARFRPTWTLAQRRDERRRHEERLGELERTVASKQHAIARLPGNVAPDVVRRMEAQRERLRGEADRVRAMVRVFSDESGTRP